MRSLFWRMFAAFWAVSVALIIAFAWSWTSTFESTKIPGLGVTRLQAAMDDQLLRTAHELDQGGVEDLHRWLAGTAGYGPGTLYVLDAQGRDLLGRDVPAGSRSASERQRTRELRASDGSVYQAVAIFEGTFLKRLIWGRPAACACAC